MVICDDLDIHWVSQRIIVKLAWILYKATAMSEHILKDCLIEHIDTLARIIDLLVMESRHNIVRVVFC